MAPHKDDLGEDVGDDDQPQIEPYTVLGISKTATADEIKSAYRKAALKHHPDKAPEHLKDTAHTKFQEIAFAYAVLSDPIRRKRYDTTGSTSESISLDNFSWADFYREQFQDIVTGEAIERFSNAYKGSDEEKDDLLNAFRKYKGKWNGIYESIMLSNPLEDEDRFRVIIDEAIGKGDVEPYKAYTEETERSKEKRMKAAREEGKEAIEYAEKLGVADKLFGKGKGKGGKKESSEDALAAVIRKRQTEGSSFLDNLEAKYAAKEKGAKSSKGKRGKKRVVEDEEDGDDGMPSEEAFQQAAARLKAGKATAGGDAEGGRNSKRTKR